MKKVILLFFIFSLFILNVFGTESIFPVDKWRTSTPEEQGMDSEILYNMFKNLKDNKTEIHTMSVIRNGYLVAEWNMYPYNKDYKSTIFSSTKTFTSTLIGIAIDEGYIKSVNEKVIDFFKDIEIDNIDEKKKKLTLKDLLTMTAGFDWTEDGNYGAPYDSWTLMRAAPDPIKYILDRPMMYEPGTYFYYNTGASHLLSAILQKVTGKTEEEYAKEKLFTPLNIKDYYWSKDKNGITYGGSGLFLNSYNMAKLGYLYLNKGKWEGKQIISEKWVKEVGSKKYETPYGLAGRNGYGYQCWINSFGGFSARGYGGQYIFVVPEKNLIVTFTSGLLGSEFFLPETLVESYILKSIKSDKPIKSNVASNKKLKTILDSSTNPAKSAPLKTLPDYAKNQNGKIYVFDNSDTVSFKFDNTSICMMTWKVNGIDYKLNVGLDGIYRINKVGGLGAMPENCFAALYGYWQDSKTFIVMYRALEDVDSCKYIYSFTKNGIESLGTSTFLPTPFESRTGKLKK